MQSISKNFNFISLFTFALPTMAMMILVSLYTIVDGIFISNYLGSNALSATNIVFPVINMLMAVGIMLATGGNAIIAKKMGEGKMNQARENFTLITVTAFLFGVFLLIVGLFFSEKISLLLGATPVLMDNCVTYLKIMMFFAPACMLQLQFQTFFVTAGKPFMGLILSVAGGLSNIFLDYVLMGPCGMGIEGAALGSGASQLIPAVVGVVYFSTIKKELFFAMPKFDAKMLLNSCGNGSSEMVSNLSTAVVTYFFNAMMLQFVGEDGVAAITIALYGQFLFNAMFLGFSMGVAPVFSYNYGLKNVVMMKRLFKICMRFVCMASLAIGMIALWGSPYIVEIFSPKGTMTYEIGAHGLVLFAFNYFVAGLNIFSSALFTAYSNGFVSAVISFLRTFAFLLTCILILPYIIGVNGIWISVPVAEFLTAFISVVFLIRHNVAAGYDLSNANEA